MSKQLYTVTKEGIEYVCSLINQIVTLPSDVIDDLNIATNTTYSSYKLNVDLNNLETNINDRTDKLIASLNKLSKKIITAESEIVDENTLYLLLIDSTNNVYQQWLLIDGSPVMVGTTEMSLDSVYTKDEADVKFGLKTVSDTLVTEVAGIKETIGTEDLTTIATTLKGAINELEAKHYLEVYDLQNTSVLDYAKTFDALTHNYFYANNCIDLPDNMNYGYCAVDVSQDPLYRDITFYCPTTGRIYVNTIGADPDDATVFGTWSGWHRHLNDDDIVTTIDSTSTDTQVPSAKAVETRISKREIIKNVDLNTFVDEGKYYIASGCTNSPIDGGYLNIMRYNDDFVCQICARYHISTSKNMYIRTKVSGAWTEWQRVCTTSVADVPKTTINLNAMSNISFGNISVFYLISNGICTVDMTFNCTTTAPILWETAYNSLPIPKYVFHTSAPASGYDSAPLLINVNTNGTMEWYIGSAVTVNRTYYVNFSYPVAES